MTTLCNSLEECVDRAIERVGPRLVVGTPLGLGKPVQLLNAFYRRAKSDPDLSLHIYTALSLEVPTPGNHIEAGLAGPIMERLFGDYEGLDYMQDLRANTVPGNIEISELYFKAGSMKGIASAQRNYISSNYTHIARDMCAQGVNVLLQLVATRAGAAGTEISLSCNPDTALDVQAALAERGEPFISIAQAHPELPFMTLDAQVGDEFFDLLLDDPSCNKRLFAVPNGAVPLADYATAVHASSLVPDGGTLQIGIGSLGDAVAHALALRHREPAAYAEMLEGLSVQRPSIQEAPEPFDSGLYCSTEMFVNGMMKLIDAGVIKRKVYDDLALQQAINEGQVGEQVDGRLLDWGRSSGFIPRTLDAGSLDLLCHWGILPPGSALSGDGLEIAGSSVANDLDDMTTREAVIGDGSRQLANGRLLHGGFFLGPRDFYDRLVSLSDSEREAICMTSVLRTNQLLQHPALYMAQRRDARFINTGMMVTLTGAVASDALEDGTVISGVGGQYNFVAMAHDLPGAHSVLCIRSTRGSGKGLQSNIVPHYGHITIPKHLRDVVVTEYGVAELRGQSDADIIKRLLNVADSRFQAELLAHAKAAGKVEQDYEIPDFARQNTPARLGTALKPHYKAGLLLDYPFGTELTNDEIALAASLRKIRALSDDPPRFISRVFRALLASHDEDLVAPFLERVDLRHPDTTRDFLVQQLLMMELEERGLLKAG